MDKRSQNATPSLSDKMSCALSPIFFIFFKNETQSVMTCLKGHGSRVTIDDCFRWENLR